MFRFLSLVLVSVFATTFLAGQPAQAAGDKLVIELKTGKVVINFVPISRRSTSSASRRSPRRASTTASNGIA